MTSLFSKKMQTRHGTKCRSFHFILERVNFTPKGKNYATGCKNPKIEIVLTLLGFFDSEDFLHLQECINFFLHKPRKSCKTKKML